MTTQIAAEGINVVLVARGKDRLHALAAELRTQYGVETMVLAVDLADSAAGDTIEALTKPLDVGLVVLAGPDSALTAPSSRRRWPTSSS